MARFPGCQEIGARSSPCCWWFQSDNGQDIVKQALDRSVGKILSRGVVRRRKTSMTDYRLEQVADYLCTIELALVKYEAKEDGETYNKFFGGIGSFKRNWLKQARGKRI